MGNATDSTIGEKRIKPATDHSSFKERAKSLLLATLLHKSARTVDNYLCSLLQQCIEIRNRRSRQILCSAT